MAQVKCKFCGNTFFAPPASAVCPKCGRPANCSLPALWRAIALFIPVIGLGYALSLRSHSPLAARQCFWISLLGLAVYGGIYTLFIK